MISVIIPTYRRASFIERAITSVLNQSYQDFEIIVVDDNDPDTPYRHTMEDVMRKYSEDKRVIYVKHPKNLNGSAARNTGIAKARGEYITFLDDDDYFLNERLATLKAALDEDQDAAAAFSSCLVTSRRKIIGDVPASLPDNPYVELLIGRFCFGSGSNIFVRASVVRELNGFDASFVRHQDIEFMLRLLQSHRIIPIKKYLLVKSQDDRTNELKLEKYIGVKQHLFESFQAEIDNLNETDRKRFYQKQYLDLAVAALAEKDYGSYAKYVGLASESLPLDNHVKTMLKLYRINNYIDVRRVKYLVKRRTIKVSKEVRKEVDFYENYQSEGNEDGKN